MSKGTSDLPRCRWRKRSQRSLRVAVARVGSVALERMVADRSVSRCGPRARRLYTPQLDTNRYRPMARISGVVASTSSTSDALVSITASHLSASARLASSVGARRSVTTCRTTPTKGDGVRPRQTTVTSCSRARHSETTCLPTNLVPPRTRIRTLAHRPPLPVGA